MCLDYGLSLSICTCINIAPFGYAWSYKINIVLLGIIIINYSNIGRADYISNT
jgi:hypothetical protein